MQMEEVESLLEEHMPDEDIPMGSHILEVVENIKPLSYDQKDMLVELFDDLKVAHDRMSRVCTRMSTLAKVLNPSQLMLVMKATIRLMIQLNTMAAFLDTSASP